MKKSDILKSLSWTAAGAVLLCACAKDGGTGDMPQTAGNDTAMAAQQTGGSGASVSENEEEFMEEVLPAEYVAGSGGYFVQMTDGIYFHSYEKEAFEDLIRDGKLLDYCLTPSEATTLCRYDEESGEVEEIVKDGCTGRLYWLGDRFYSERYGENGNEVVTITPEGETDVLYTSGRIAGDPEVYAGSARPEGTAVMADGSMTAAGRAEASEEGPGSSEASGALAIWHFGDNGTALDVIDAGGNVLYTIPADMVDYYSFCGLVDTNVIYRTIDEEGLVTLYAYDGTRSVRLGDLTKTGEYSNPRCEQLFEDNGTIYCVMGWHSGVYDDYKDFQAMSFDAGSEGSLEVLLEGYDVLSMPKIEAYRAPHFELQNGTVSMNGQIPGSVSLSEGDYGDLVLYRSPEEIVIMADDLISYQDRESLKIQASQVFGDTLYLMVAGVEYVPEADYDWLRFYRYANRMYYLRFDLPEGGGNYAAMTVSGGDTAETTTGETDENGDTAAADIDENTDTDETIESGDTGNDIGLAYLPVVITTGFQGEDAECFYGADWNAAYSFDSGFYEDFIGDWLISEIPVDTAAAAAEGEEEPTAAPGRQASTRTTLISFTDERHAVVTQDLYVGGTYELSCEIVDGKTMLTGFCPLFGHHFTAWFENGELNVEFVQRMLSTWGDETKTWKGFYITAPAAEEAEG